MKRKEREIRNLQDGTETDSLIRKQFIHDQALGECMRKIQTLMNDWELRPLEREMLLIVLLDHEKASKQMRVGNSMLKNSVGLVKQMLGKE